MARSAAFDRALEIAPPLTADTNHFEKDHRISPESASEINGVSSGFCDRVPGCGPYLFDPRTNNWVEVPNDVLLAMQGIPVELLLAARD